MNHPHWRLCVLFLLSVAAGHARDVYRLSSLEGLSVIHTDFGKRVNESGALSASPDRIAGEITISIEKEGDEDQHYIEHNGGKHRVFSVRGKNSITFVESYGGSIFLWTVCLEEKNKDGSFLLIMTANLTDGALGIRNKVFRGKATPLK